MKHRKPTWNQIWMLLAESIADKSSDTHRKNGSVIVTGDNASVLGIGYNKTKKDSTNKSREDAFDHAVAMVLLNFNFGDFREKKMYITEAPCEQCANMIVSTDIRTVIYRNDCGDNTGLNILKSSGINLVRA